MTISLFELFSVGIGPSSSHTVGPMRAAARFARYLAEEDALNWVREVRVLLHGALAATGRGHGTIEAVMLGLEGHEPDLIDPAFGRRRVDAIRSDGTLRLAGARDVPWTGASIELRPFERFDRHPNALTLTARLDDGSAREQRWYSVGGGFIVGEDETATDADAVALPHPFGTTAELLAHCRNEASPIASIVRANERARRDDAQISADIATIWQVMLASIERGLATRGILPGGLNVPRRAADLFARVRARTGDPDAIGDVLSIAAMAVNEENAAGNRIVTAPTNGAAGVLPAVLRHALDHDESGRDSAHLVEEFLLTATAIGSIVTQRASISGAEVGCQGEVGTACAMAAAALAAVRGGTPEQVENAAEIGMEHHLGMTCDPIAGLVQIPCIERNGVAAVKAVHAARLALLSDGTHRVSFDQVVETMRQTGADMSHRYKETSEGGLAVNVPVC